MPKATGKPPQMPPTPLGLGRIAAKDDKDSLYPMSAYIAENAPKVNPLKKFLARLWRYFRIGPVLNQGALPHCVGYTWRQFLSSAPLMTKGGPSATEIYVQAQLIDEWPGEDYDGTSTRAGVKVLQRLGYIKSYVHARSVQDIKEFILNGLGTVAVGTNWYDNMFKVDADGYARIGGNVAGGHAYLIIGYSVKRNAFRCVNSWGTSWGQKGKFWLDAGDLQRLLEEDGEAIAAVEQKVMPVAA